MYFGYCITLYIDMVVKATTTWWEENYFLHTGLELGTCDCDVRRWQSGEFTKILLQTQGDTQQKTAQFLVWGFRFVLF